MLRKRKRDQAVGPADPTGLRPFIFGDRNINEWPAAAKAIDGEPWRSFADARSALHAGQTEQAKALWLNIAMMPSIESRQVLQAWHFLRDIGVAPPAEDAKTAYGAVAEVSVSAGHDLLAAYADGAVRYLNFSGSAVVVEPPSTVVEGPVTELLRISGLIARAIGPWEGDELPVLPVAHSRLTILTPSGPHLGQGPDAILRSDPMASGFFDAATVLLLAVTQLRNPT